MRDLTTNREGRRFESCRAHSQKSCKTEAYYFVQRSPPVPFASATVFCPRPRRVGSKQRVGKRAIGKEMEHDATVAILAKVGKRADSEGGEARCSRCF